MFGWWAACFFFGILVPSTPEGTVWGFAAGLLPLLGPAASGCREDPFRRRLLMRTVLTALTGLVFYQHACVVLPDRAAERPAASLATASERVPAPVVEIRDHVRSVCASRRLDPGARGMLLALLLADRSALDPAISERWRSLGIAHFLALSGLHLGIIALPVYRLVGLLRLRGPVREAAAFLVLSLYAAAAGAPLSLLRAAALLLVVRVHLLAGRRAHHDEALLAGAWIVCLFIPRSVSDPGFLLSVCAAGGVLLVGLPLGRALGSRGRTGVRRMAGYIIAALCVSFSATLFTMPLATRLFGRAPLSGPLLSVLLAPLVTALLYAGFAYVAAGHLLGAAGAAPVNLLASAVMALPELFPTRYNAAVIRGDMNETVFTGGAALLALAMGRGRTKRRLAAIAGLALVVSFCIGSEPRGVPLGDGGDTLSAGVVMDPRGGTLLIEGPLSERRAVLISRRLNDRGVRAVDRTIVTHGGCLSIAGLSVLDQRVSLRRVYVSPWLIECRGAAGLNARGRIVALYGTLRVALGRRSIRVSGPGVVPGRDGVFARSDTELRIYVLDSDRQ
ncbi:MAG: ComEC/Rec2 family competence protein [Candidatus Krumholzibacteria bacterium]|nr:ComEC/Rec2 family competence protein [Candidatus Krumholzibacteria bacterium]